jgi:hypothetical protein
MAMNQQNKKKLTNGYPPCQKSVVGLLLTIYLHIKRQKLSKPERINARKPLRSIFGPKHAHQTNEHLEFLSPSTPHVCKSN